MGIPKNVTFEGLEYSTDERLRVAAALSNISPDGNGIEVISAASNTTIGEQTTLVDLAVDGAFNLTMPPAVAGRHLKVFWSVEQATGDRQFNCAGSDTFAGNVNHTVEASGDSTMDSIPVANTTVRIVSIDDTNIGSYLDFRCSTDGTWLVSGHLVIDAIGNVVTLA